MPNTAKEPQVTLGRAICLRREELEMSQQTLGLELGKDQGWISHIENGRTNLAYGTVDRIARALGWRCRSSSRSPSRSRQATASRCTYRCDHKPDSSLTVLTTASLARVQRADARALHTTPGELLRDIG